MTPDDLKKLSREEIVALAKGPVDPKCQHTFTELRSAVKAGHNVWLTSTCVRCGATRQQIAEAAKGTA